MNLEDVIHPAYGLQQDEWSLSKPRFGEHGQLEVIGWSGRNSGHKFYVVKCQECSVDTELFGSGHFKSTKGNLSAGAAPCGCSKIPKWTEEQWKVVAQRKSTELGYEFVGFVGEWLRGRTKVKLVCSKHGTFDVSSLNSFVNNGCGCYNCGREETGTKIKKSDSDMIISFFNTGAFHHNTRFWRSNRKDSQGTKRYWSVYCPECDSVGEATSSCLKRGSRPCLCSKSRQKQAYINFAKDNGDIVAIKFGIANNAKQRIKKQNYISSYDIENYCEYKFSTKQSCRAAERECKQSLVCGVVDKELMPDGWTETTYPYNIDKIIEIYEKHGGVRI